MVRAAHSFLAGLIVLLAPPAAAEEADVPTLWAPNAIREQIGKPAKILGVVTRARLFPRRAHVALELDGPRKGRGAPACTAFVHGESLLVVTGQPTARKARAWLRALLGRRLRVAGKVEVCRGRPRIVLTRREQLEVIE